METFTINKKFIEINNYMYNINEIDYVGITTDNGKIVCKLHLKSKIGFNLGGDANENYNKVKQLLEENGLL